MEEVKHREQPENVSEFRKWLVVLGCNVVLIFVLGLNQAIGPFFVELMRHFDEGAGQTSLIVTLSVFFTTCTGPVANLMSKRFGCRVTVITGGVLSTVGHLLSFFANSVPFLCLSYGVLVGLGFGLAYSPSVGMVSKYFKKGHALANGLAYTGSGLGIFIFPPFLQVLIDTYGWKGSFLAFSSVNANICVCGALFTEPGKLLTERECSDDARTGVEDTDQPVEEENHSDKTACRSDDAQGSKEYIASRAKKTPSRGDVTSESKISTIGRRIVKSFDLYLFRESVPFVLVVVSTFFLGFGHYITVVYLLPRAESLKFSNKQGSAFLVSIMGICSIVGRGSQGLILKCKSITGSRLYIISLLTAGLAALLSQLARTYVTYAVYCALIGLSSGMYLPLIVVTLTDFLGREKLIASLGLATASLGIGLVGTPIAGWIYDATNNYDHVYYLAGVSLCLSGLIVVLVPCCERVTMDEKASSDGVGYANSAYDDKSDDVTYMSRATQTANGI